MMLIRDCCPACGGSARTLYRCGFDEPPISTFLNSYYARTISVRAEYRADECLACGTIYQVEVGDEELLLELYGQWIGPTKDPETDPSYRFALSNPRLSRDGHEIMAAAAFLNKLPSEMVTLDYGMGWGCWARISKSLGCKSYGFDLAPCRQAFAEHHGVITELDGAQFDFINTEQLFEHVTDPRRTASDLAARLKPGGILKISVPSNRGIAATLSRLASGQESISHAEIMPLHPFEHVNCFTMAGLTNLTGMRPVRPSYRERFAFLPGVSHRYPKAALKELARPFYQWRNPTNLYAWFVKAKHHAGSPRPY